MIEKLQKQLDSNEKELEWQLKNNIDKAITDDLKKRIDMLKEAMENRTWMLEQARANF